MLPVVLAWVLALLVSGCAPAGRAPGYDLECGPGHGCVFGPRWSDESDAALSHDGCDTRNNILARDLADVRFKRGSRGCVVSSGVLLDPYTGELVRFSRSRPSQVQIDHVIARRWAWDHGADTWPQRLRTTFANDPDNLLATSGSVNASKGADSPAQWAAELPWGEPRCRFLARAELVLDRYPFDVEPAEQARLRWLGLLC